MSENSKICPDIPYESLDSKESPDIPPECRNYSIVSFEKIDVLNLTPYEIMVTICPMEESQTTWKALKKWGTEWITWFEWYIWGEWTEWSEWLALERQKNGSTHVVRSHHKLAIYDNSFKQATVTLSRKMADGSIVISPTFVNRLCQNGSKIRAYERHFP